MYAIRSYYEHVGVVAVTPRAADLLIVVLQRLGQAHVHYETDVAFVDPHTKSDGRNDDAHLIIDECTVDAVALRITSYNVCYTKLLRIDRGVEKHGGGVLHLQ